MLRKFYFFVFLFFLLTLSTGLFPKKVFSDESSCPSQVSIDEYKCNPPVNDICGDVVYVGPNQNSCSWNSNKNTCLSTFGVSVDENFGNEAAFESAG